MRHLDSILLLLECAGYPEGCSPCDAAGCMLEGDGASRTLRCASMVGTALMEYSSVVLNVAVDGEIVLEACRTTSA